jgi:hypothetical protein
LEKLWVWGRVQVLGQKRPRRQNTPADRNEKALLLIKLAEGLVCRFGSHCRMLVDVPYR